MVQIRFDMPENLHRRMTKWGAEKSRSNVSIMLEAIKGQLDAWDEERATLKASRQKKSKKIEDETEDNDEDSPSESTHALSKDSPRALAKDSPHPFLDSSDVEEPGKKTHALSKDSPRALAKDATHAMDSPSSPPNSSSPVEVNSSSRPVEGVFEGLPGPLEGQERSFRGQSQSVRVKPPPRPPPVQEEVLDLRPGHGKVPIESSQEVLVRPRPGTWPSPPMKPLGPMPPGNPSPQPFIQSVDRVADPPNPRWVLRLSASESYPATLEQMIQAMKDCGYYQRGMGITGQERDKSIKDSTFLRALSAVVKKVG